MKTAVIALACLLAPSQVSAADPPPKTILLIAGAKSHGPGEHEYEKGARLLAHCINTSPNLKGFKAEVYTDGWPKDEKAFDNAATVLLFSDGSDRDEKAHPLLREKRLATMAKLMERGVGFVAIHYTVFVPTKKGGEDFLDWCGGYFDYESGEKPRGWYSKIKTCTGKVDLASPKHPVSRGLKPFELREEFYYNMRLAPAERGLSPILSATLPDEKEAQVVAWAIERKNSGRGFGYTGGHFHSNWQDENVRRMVLNALVWTAKGEVPEGGVRSTLPDAEKKPAAAKPQAATGPSSDESFVSIKADTTGRLFVGGREALFVYEPDDKGGYRPRRELFRQVAEQFRTTVITTRQGVTVSGLVVGETADVVELLLGDTTRKEVHKKDVGERTISNLSSMPAGLVKKPQELHDLLAYLLGEKPLPP